MRCQRTRTLVGVGIRLIVAVSIGLMIVGPVAVVAPFGSTEAMAGHRDGSPSFLQRLFGVFRQDEPPRATREQRPRSSKPKAIKPKKKKKRKATTPTIPTVEIQPKNPDARKILVVGDFVARDLAWGLGQRFAEEPSLEVTDQSEENSGLARDDHFDWNDALPKLLNEVQPYAIVLAFGANDRQGMQKADGSVELRSDEWNEAYTDRIASILETLRVYQRPYFWVGAPPMRAESASSDMARFNELFASRLKKIGGGFFVDVWNGFVDKDGRFIASGPDVEGQERQLRERNGINFTRAGKLKLAFYVEREMRRQIGLGKAGSDTLATVTQGSRIEIDEDGTRRLVGPIISLNDPIPGFAHELAGGGDPQASPPKDSPQYKLIVRGEPLPIVAGRADDFSWPPREMEEFSFPIDAPDPIARVDPLPAPIAAAPPMRPTRPTGLAN